MEDEGPLPALTPTQLEVMDVVDRAEKHGGRGAKGVGEPTVVVKHGLRAVLTPIITLFGLDLGLLLGGAILTETTFSLPGIGKYAVDAIVTNDLPKVLGVTLVAAIFIVLANLVVDLLYAVVDPRVRTR